MGRLLLLFFISVLFSFCGNSEQAKGIVPKEKMIPLLTDFHIANGYSSSVSGDSTQKKVAEVYKAVYKKHGTDSVGFRKSLKYYIEHPEDLEQIYKDVDSNISRIQQAEQKRLDLINKKEEEKIKLKDDIARNKQQYEADKAKMKKGEYDFGLSTYTPSYSVYFHLQPYSKAPVNTSSAADSTSR